MLSDSDILIDSRKISDVIEWAAELSGIEKIIFHISCDSSKEIENILNPSEIAKKCGLTLSTGNGDKQISCGKPDVLIVLGKSGRDEITEAIIRIAKENTDPKTITEETLEKHLLYNVNPDFVIKTGGNHLTDFLIWQSVYSELFFTDINWNKFRKVDFVRALRDYQSRNRRFGK